MVRVDTIEEIQEKREMEKAPAAEKFSVLDYTKAIASTLALDGASIGNLIKDGRISHPVKGATIIGNGPDILKQVSMIGNDLSLDSGVGTCGKDGQSVPVGVGQPTLKIDNIVVGGTN